MISGLVSFYKPKYLKTLIYMLQRTEYEVVPYLRWHWQTNNFNKVMKRGALKRTKRARLLLALLTIGVLTQIIISVWLVYLGIVNSVLWQIEIGVCIFVSYPLVWAYLITVPLIIARFIVVKPKERKLVKRSKKIFADTKAVKIAVAGSYGKTTMKELLAEVLSEGKRVAVTPANKNVAVSHAQFASKLNGDEEVLVIELGEGKPGDVVNFSETIKPNIGIITGLAPAHLDHYADLDDAGRDIFALADFLKDKSIYVNGESEPVNKFVKPSHEIYTYEAVGKDKIKNIKVDYTGTSFELEHDGEKLKLKSELLGRHQVGPLAAVAVIALKLGLTKKQVEDGIARTVPFEHRMQPRILGGAWIIDDTYNGNIDGIKAGLQLLTELPADRKIYITPGLVDQGVETKSVHGTMGKLIAAANPDKVVLMRNSVSDIISSSMKSAGYKGDLKIENDPLNFYLNLEQFVAAGDLVLMQNDWPDNYY